MSKSQLSLTLNLVHPDLDSEERKPMYIESVTSNGQEIGLFLTDRIMSMLIDYSKRRNGTGTGNVQSKVSKQKQIDSGQPSVYVLHDKLRDTYKIGYSKQPKIREKTLQAEVPSIEMIAVYSGTMADEKTLHIHFARKRLRGEWFKLIAEDLAAIDRYFNSPIR